MYQFGTCLKQSALICKRQSATTAYLLLTGRYFAREWVVVGARFVFETFSRVANAINILIRLSTTTPPAVSRRIPIEPIRRCVILLSRLVQPEPVVLSRVTTDDKKP